MSICQICGQVEAVENQLCRDCDAVEWSRVHEEMFEEMQVILHDEMVALEKKGCTCHLYNGENDFEPCEYCMVFSD